MSFFHPSSHPLNPFGTGAHLPQRPQAFYPIAIPTSTGISSSQSALFMRKQPNSSPSRMSQEPRSGGANDRFVRKKIYVRTEEEQFALPMSKVETNDGLVSLLSRLYSQDMLHRLQIRYDTTVLDGKGNPAGPISGGAVIYPEYWESLVEDGMRIVIKVLSEEGEVSGTSAASPLEASRTISQSSSYCTPMQSEVSSGLSGVSGKPSSNREIDLAMSRHHLDMSPSASQTNKENDSGQFSQRGSVDSKPRTYSSAVKQATVQPLAVSTNLPSGTQSAMRYSRITNDQQHTLPDLSSEQNDKMFRPGRMSAMTFAEASLKAVTNPYGLTYQSCITLLEQLLPETHRITHPRLSPNIVTIRPCHENTLWMYCVVQQALYPVTVRAFETIDIEELIVRMVPPEVGKDRVVILWRNMKFGGEGIGSKYNAKKETRGTGGRNMWKRNLAVLAVKNAEVFVLVFELPAGLEREMILSTYSGVIDLTADNSSLAGSDSAVAAMQYSRVPCSNDNSKYSVTSADFQSFVESHNITEHQRHLSKNHFSIQDISNMPPHSVSTATQTTSGTRVDQAPHDCEQYESDVSQAMPASASHIYSANPDASKVSTGSGQSDCGSLSSQRHCQDGI